MGGPGISTRSDVLLGSTSDVPTTARVTDDEAYSITIEQPTPSLAAEDGSRNSLTRTHLSTVVPAATTSSVAPEIASVQLRVSLVSHRVRRAITSPRRRLGAVPRRGSRARAEAREV